MKRYTRILDQAWPEALLSLCLVNFIRGCTTMLCRGRVPKSKLQLECSSLSMEKPFQAQLDPLGRQGLPALKALRAPEVIGAIGVIGATGVIGG